MFYPSNYGRIRDKPSMWCFRRKRCSSPTYVRFRKAIRSCPSCPEISAREYLSNGLHSNTFRRRKQLRSAHHQLISGISAHTDARGIKPRFIRKRSFIDILTKFDQLLEYLKPSIRIALRRNDNKLFSRRIVTDRSV